MYGDIVLPSPNMADNKKPVVFMVFLIVYNAVVLIRCMASHNKRPPLIRQDGIKKDIHMHPRVAVKNTYDGIVLSLRQGWWEMLELQQKVINHRNEFPNDLGGQIMFAYEKKQLIANKEKSKRKLYSRRKRNTLKQWALAHLGRNNLQVLFDNDE